MKEKSKNIILLTIYIIGILIIVSTIYLTESNNKINEAVKQYSLTEQEIFIITNDYNKNFNYSSYIEHISTKIDFYMIINSQNQGAKPIDLDPTIDFNKIEIKRILNSLNINDDLVKNFYILSNEYYQSMNNSDF